MEVAQTEDKQKTTAQSDGFLAVYSGWVPRFVRFCKGFSRIISKAI